MNLGPAVRLAAAAALVTLGATASAQSKPVAPRPAPAVPVPPPPAALAAPSSSGTGVASQAMVMTRDTRDFDQVAGRWGAAFFGVRSVEFGSFPPGVPNTVEVVTLGVRRWMAPGSMGASRPWAIDAGLGFAYGRTKTETAVTGGTSSSQASGFGLGFHLGLPIALAQGRHVTAILAPEVDLLYASGKADQGTPLRIVDWRGLGFDVGARLGAELYFGFLDMPQLALEGSLGVKARYDSVSMKPKVVGQSDVSHWRLGSDRPFGFLTGNVAAIYYF